MNLSTAVEGFLLHESIEGLGEHTLGTYTHQLVALARFLSHPDIESTSPEDLRRFFGLLRNEYTPTRWNGDRSRLTSRSRRNYWIVCRPLW